MLGANLKDLHVTVIHCTCMPVPWAMTSSAFCASVYSSTCGQKTTQGTVLWKVKWCKNWSQHLWARPVPPLWEEGRDRDLEEMGGREEKWQLNLVVYISALLVLCGNPVASLDPKGTVHSGVIGLTYICPGRTRIWVSWSLECRKILSIEPIEP